MVQLTVRLNYIITLNRQTLGHPAVIRDFHPQLAAKQHSLGRQWGGNGAELDSKRMQAHLLLPYLSTVE